MQFNVSENLGALLPWELTLTIDGKDYKTRRPTLGLLGKIKQLAKITDQEATKTLGEMFEQPLPDFAAWSMETLQVCLAHYMTYLGEHTTKNSPTVAALVKAATAKV